MTTSAKFPSRLVLKIAIATAGRRSTLSRTLVQLSTQARLPDEVLICPASEDDCDSQTFARLPYRVRVYHCEQRGSCAQRNTLIRQLGTCDVVVFLDDDFYPSTTYLQNVDLLFSEHSDIVGATGQVLADGAVTSGISHREAVEMLRQDEMTEGARTVQARETYALYGCNMAVRAATIRKANILFDEALPLYGWLEDIDFSRSVASYGRIVHAEALRGVHLAEKRGRSRGVPLGYSQIANPVYLLRKGTLSPKHALRQVSRNVVANICHSMRPEPWIDRRGRLRGNALAAAHLLWGRLDPRFVTEL